MSLREAAPLAVREDLLDVEPYVSPQRPARYRLNTNESPYAPSAAFLEDLARATSELQLNRYPDKDAVALVNAIARHEEWPPEGVWVANGSNEILLHLLLAYGGPKRTAITFEPTYSLHSLIPKITGTRVLSQMRDEEFEVDLDAAVRAMTEVGPEIVMVCSPNNPTGVLEPQASIEVLLEEAPGLVVLDEAYIDFAGSEASARALLGRRNLVITRTFSKAWGLAGARIGYLLADPSVVEGIARVRLPYHLSALGQVAGEVALQHAGEAAAAARAVAGERDRVAIELQAMGLKTIPSHANFILFEVEDPPRVWRALLERGVLVRIYAGVARLERSLRVTAGLPEDNDAFLDSMAEVLDE